MELNSYQLKVMEDLSSYLSMVNSTGNIIEAWTAYWQEKDIAVGLGGVPTYKNRLPGTPHICLKVPTGGGKTFIASAALKTVFDHLSKSATKLVVWLVPSDSILTQTVKNLKNTNHAYRMRLDRDFGGSVGVYEKDDLLSGAEFSPETVHEMLTVCVFSYASLRIDSKKKDVRKVYQENGNLRRFAEMFKAKDTLLADTPDTALIQVLRYLSPVVIVDESHNAGSKLSVEMLLNLNPSFVLELTATPRENSNIISYVDARELKRENMVKLPVVVFGRSSRQSVITDAIHLRGNIEKQAIAEEKAGGSYIRPIVLFQAQPKTNEDSETFDKIKNILIELGIPEEEIAVKTSKIDDLAKKNLLDRKCSIRYIITVNALKEGWDCPFAYILASLANRTSKVEVEQILGRVLRQPFAKKHNAPLLNTSYVLSCSRDFRSTLESIVAGLNQAGFSRKDCRVAEEKEHTPTPNFEQPELPLTTYSDSTEETSRDDFDDIRTGDAKSELGVYDTSVDENSSEILANMVKEATETVKDYQTTSDNYTETTGIRGDLADMVEQFTIEPQYLENAKKLCIPQFFQRTTPDLFGGEYRLLEPEHLSEGFTLRDQDAQVSFELSAGDVYNVDIEAEGEAVPKYKKASREESDFLREYIESLPPEGRIRECSGIIARQINKNNRYSTRDVAAYVERIVSGMTDDEIAAMELSLPVYAQKIQKKIDTLEAVHREQKFRAWLDAGKIICQPSYILPNSIVTADPIDSIPKSLYVAEKNDMNNFERDLLDALVGLPGILWWHRIIERKGFRLNGAFNHYPDFIAQTKSGKTLLIEAKGDYLDGDDSRAKLALGRKWQSLAGREYRYFMVFKEKELGLDGAYSLDKFIGMIKDV